MRNAIVLVSALLLCLTFSTSAFANSENHRSADSPPAHSSKTADAETDSVNNTWDRLISGIQQVADNALSDEVVDDARTRVTVSARDTARAIAARTMVRALTSDISFAAVVEQLAQVMKAGPDGFKRVRYATHVSD